ncbi:unnamed protein product, partial [Brassica oleracea var. botrytis]
MTEQENHDGSQISTHAASDLKLLTPLITFFTLSSILTTPLLRLLPTFPVPPLPCRRSSILTFLLPLP